MVFGDASFVINLITEKIMNSYTDKVDLNNKVNEPNTRACICFCHLLTRKCLMMMALIVSVAMHTVCNI